MLPVPALTDAVVPVGLVVALVLRERFFRMLGQSFVWPVARYAVVFGRDGIPGFGLQKVGGGAGGRRSVSSGHPLV